MNDAEKAILTFKQEATNYYGKDAVYRRIKQEMEDRIARFNRRQGAMASRADTHAKLAQLLYDEDFQELNVIVKRRGGEDYVKYNITTLADVREHIEKAKFLFERGIQSDMEYLNALVEEQETVAAMIPD